MEGWHPTINASAVKFFREGDSTCDLVSDSFDNERDIYSPHIVRSGAGRLHLAWSEDSGSQTDIFYRKTSDNGDTFSPPLASNPVNISNTALASEEPLLGFDGSLNVDVVWVEGVKGNRKVAFSRSTDEGETFSYPQTISSTDKDSYCPRIAASGEGKIYIAYRGDGGSDRSIYFGRWESATSTFSSPLKISPGSDSPSCPEMAVGANGVIYVTWADGGEIGVAVSTDSGYSFHYPKNISNSDGVSSSPKIAVNGSYINIVWVEEGTGSGDIFFSGSVDYGKNFSTPENLSNSSSPSSMPVIASDGRDYIYVAWVEGAGGEGEIYFLRDKGARGLPPPAERTLAQRLDINGDGKSDIVIGAPEADGAGKVYIAINVQASSSGDYTLSESSAGDKFGYAVAIAGDINGDGYADVIVGAPYADDTGSGKTDNGIVYIYYGGPSSLMDSVVDVVIVGSGGNDHLGYAVSPAGDVNGDGFDDVIIGAPYADSAAGSGDNRGKAYVIYGGSSVPYEIDRVGSSSWATVLNGLSDFALFGTSLGYAGDVNNDGYGDIVVGGQYMGTDPGFIGRAYVYLGGVSVDSAPDATFIGEYQEDRFGAAVAGAGDVDGDGYYDLLVGAYLADGGGADRGRAYLYLGGNITPGSVKYSSKADAIFTGSVDGGRAGYSLYRR